MTPPANDSFALGLPLEPTRPSYSSLSLRSSTPKLSFVSGAKASHSTVARKKSTPTVGRLVSVGNSNRTTLSGDPDDTRTTDLPSQTAKKAAELKPRTLPQPPKPVKTAIDWEVPRKTLHSSIGFLTLYLYASHGSSRTVIVVLTVALVIIVPLDILRLRSAGFERLYERCVGFLMRESEKKSTNGVIWYIIGVIFVLSVYPLDIATVSILILSWADTAASTIGRLWGPYTPALPRRLPILALPLAPRKSLAGFIAATVTGTAIAVGFWSSFAALNETQNSWHAIDNSRWLAVVGLPLATASTDDAAKVTGWIGLGVLGLVSGIVSGVAEALDLGSWDDNMTLPIISGGCIWGFFKVLEYLSS